LHKTIENSDFVCLVTFKGSWCEQDKKYLQELGEFCKKQSSNVELIAWTSESQLDADRANKEWRLTEDYGFTVLGDETNKLADWLRENEMLPEITTVQHAGYPNGMVLPAQVWWAHHGTPIVEWCLVRDGPERPQPEAVWTQACKRKHALDLGNTIAPNHGTSLEMMYVNNESAPARQAFKV